MKIIFKYGWPLSLENEAVILIKLNQEEYSYITPKLKFEFNFGSSFSNYYRHIIFNTVISTNTEFNCMSQTCFDVKNSNDLKVLEFISEKGRFNYLLRKENTDELSNYEIVLNESQITALKKMIGLIKDEIDKIPEDNRNPEKAMKEVLLKPIDISYKEFLKETNPFEKRSSGIKKKDRDKLLTISGIIVIVFVLIFYRLIVKIAEQLSFIGTAIGNILKSIILNIFNYRIPYSDEDFGIGIMVCIIALLIIFIVPKIIVKIILALREQRV